jgi:hypothetical protein
MARNTYNLRTACGYYSPSTMINSLFNKIKIRLTRYITVIVNCRMLEYTYTHDIAQFSV